MTHETLERARGDDQTVFGGWVTARTEVAVEAFAYANYDYIAIDCQHSLMDEGDAGHLLRPLLGSRVASFVRVGGDDDARIGRALDAGADGIIVPMVNSFEDAARALAACRYAPDGVRSLGPIHPGLPRVAGELQARVSCFVMTETAESIEKIDEICATPGITGIYVGPSDLSHSLGLPPGSGFSRSRPDLLHEAFMRVVAACRNAGVVPGVHAGSGSNAHRLAEDGFRLVTLASDAQILGFGAKAELEVARSQT